MKLIDAIRKLVNNIFEMRKGIEKKERRFALFIPLVMSFDLLFLFIISLFYNGELIGFNIILIIAFVIHLILSTFFLIYFFHIMEYKSSNRSETPTSDFHPDELFKWK